MGFPSWKEFTKKLSKLEKDVSQKISEFKENHPLLSKAIKESLKYLPSPFNGIAQNLYDSFEGTEEEKSNYVIQYLELIKSLGEKHYTESILKLNSISAEMDDIKILTAKEDTVQNILDVLTKTGRQQERKFEELRNEIKGLGEKMDVFSSNMNQQFQSLSQQLSQMLSKANYQPGPIDLNSKPIPLKEDDESKIQYLEKKIDELEKKIDEKEIRELELQRDNINLFLQRAAYHFYKQEYEKTDVLCDAILSIDKENIAALNNKGLVLSKLGKHKKAMKYFDKALSLDEDYPDTWINIGFAFLNLGTQKKATENYAEAVECYQEAISCLDKAIELEPKNYVGWFNKGNAFAILEQFDEEIACYDEAIKLNVNDPEVWYNKGIAHQILQEYKEAIECFNKVIQIKPDFTSAREKIKFIQRLKSQ